MHLGMSGEKTITPKKSKSADCDALTCATLIDNEEVPLSSILYGATQRDDFLDEPSQSQNKVLAFKL